MKVKLMHRTYGIHTPRKEVNIPGKLKDYGRYHRAENEWKLDEDKILRLLPKGFLPVKPAQCLLSVADSDGCSSGQYKYVKRFRPWAKYFDAYCLELQK